MADNNNMGRDRDLVLAPGEFAYVQDTTKGNVQVNVGPSKTSMSDTDKLVIFDEEKLRFSRVDMERAIQTNAIAPEGFYLALFNPAKDGKPPLDGKASVSVELNIGHRVNIPGPTQFPLWPGQMVRVIQGHHLRSNQYLLAQVYNDVEASANWQQAVLKPVTDGAPVAVEAAKFTPGQLLVIKGTEVAFFIPPTGIKVLPDPTTSLYVREAVTLERLEYSILKSEDGNKRFVQGPDVVFPEPTETFVEKDGTRKLAAIELNDTSGLYIKVIADYMDGATPHLAGDELFITGKEQAIYFQREEHSIIRYGDQTKHYAVAIPPGEGRYVLNRLTGNVRLADGPQMLLCDPRFEVIVRRVLTDKESRLLYPGNAEAIRVNQELASASEAGSVGAGAAAYEVGRAASAMNMMASYASTETNATRTSRQIAGDMFDRKSKFTPPRSITLDTKYEGAVGVSAWPGYAVMVMDKAGARRVEQGPKAILLAYDETLAALELSTGTPKTDARLFSTVYLRVRNNRVNDQFTVETQDLVTVTLNVSYRLNFEGADPEQWFAVENYVQLLCDHVRSLIRNVAKRQEIATFYAQSTDIIRDAVLGAVGTDGKRPGRLFVENGMRVYDVEVLSAVIRDTQIAALLWQAQTQTMTSALDLARRERELHVTLRLETIQQQIDQAKSQTALVATRLDRDKIDAVLVTELQRVAAEAETAQARLTAQQAAQEVLNGLNASEIARREAVAAQDASATERRLSLEVGRIHAETEDVVKRAGALNAQMTAAMTTFADQALVERLSESLAPLSAMSGVSAADVMAKLLKGTPFQSVLEGLATRTRVPLDTSA